MMVDVYWVGLERGEFGMFVCEVEKRLTKKSYLWLLVNVFSHSLSY